MEANNQHSYPLWLVPIDIARKLKEIGFKGGVLSEDLTLVTKKQLSGDLGYCTFNLDDFEEGEVPTWEQAFEWFRKNGYHANIDYVFHKKLKTAVGYEYEIIRNNNIWIVDCYFETYEEARNSCLEELIKIYKDGDK